ncbi:hypothetical protein [Planomicrobium okeanokoites]|uniref:hypothetical protein n=1 Tax=Planomicrobium okeanokoites TaxID=244 RepID=UPI000A0512B1|nr:hypothetical protein [Planomicrobium okeanokoites]
MLRLTKFAGHNSDGKNGRMIEMAFLDKLTALKDKSIEKGKAHWEENKDDYKEKASTYKDKAIVMKDDVANKIKERTKK